MTEAEIKREAEEEFTKGYVQLAMDLIREANADGKPEDLTKHLLKRLGIHQLALDRQARRTNCLLLILSGVMAIGAVFSVLTYCKM